MKYVRLLLAMLLSVAGSPLYAQHAPTDSALSRNIQKDVDSVSLNPRLNSRSKRALLRIDARADSIRYNPTDTVTLVKTDTVVKHDTTIVVKTDTIVVVRVDTVYVTKPDTSTPPDTTTPPDTVKPPITAWTHPYAPLPDSAAFAEFPRGSVSLAVPPPTRTIKVVSLQQALDTAQTGDLLKIPAVHTTDNLLVKPTSRALWVTIQGTDSTSVIRGTVGGATSAIGILSGAHHVRFLGPLSIIAATDATNAIIRSNNGETQRSQLAHHIILDGVTVDSRGFLVRRCVWPDGLYMAVVNSRLLGCASKGGDAQGIELLNDGGPYLFENNYIEGGHQCFMSGGGDPSIKDGIPSDVVFRNNICFKPLYWHFTIAGQYNGRERQVKTGLETKKIRRALFEYNLFENVWADAQAGFCVLFKSTNQDGGDPNAQTVDVTYRYNRCRNVNSGMNLAAHPQGGLPMTRVSAYHNYFENLSTKGGEGICMQILDDVRDNLLLNNTCSNSGNNAISFDGASGVKTSVLYNNFPAGAYGVKGNATGIGIPSVNKWILPSGLFTQNAILGCSPSQYPAGTICSAPVPANVGADLTKVHP